MASDFDLDRYDLAALARRTGVKWRRGGEPVLAAWIADMDFPLAPEIGAAIASLVATDDLGYPDASLEAAVRTAYARRSLERHGHAVDPDDVVIVSDVVQGIYLTLLALTAPGDGIAILTPSYPPFFAAVADTGRRVLACDLVPGEDRYELDVDALTSVVRSGEARCLLLCSPHNPTGRCFSRGELSALADLARDADLLVVSDEIHADLVLHGASHVPFASLGPEVAARTVTLSSASKAFNVAGLRCAVAAFGSAALRERFERFPAHARGSVGVPGMVAAVVAWEQGGAWLDAVLAKLASHRDVVASYVAAQLDGTAHRRPEATYLAWLDFRGAGLGDDPAAWLREHAGVALSPGPDFGAAGRGHARLNFATPRPVLDEILERIGAALGG